MQIQTHQMIDQRLCGKAGKLEDGYSEVEYRTTSEMAVDETGLVHGGFIFGLADYAAMIAVNHPNVVLGGADVRFLKPVRAGEEIIANARVTETEGKKKQVAVTVYREKDEKIFEGKFTCFILDKHVLG
jgi:uncharacterized protein (TIGR00369 family)